MRSVRGGGQNRILFSCSIRVHSRAGPAPASLSGVPTGRFKNCKICRRGSAPGRIESPNVRESGCAAMRRFGGVGSISPGPGILRYLADPRGMVRLVDTRRLSATVCDALRHRPRWRAMAHLSRDGAGRGSLGCSAMFRLTGSGGHGRLSSGTAAGSAVSSSHCLRSEGIFSREPGRVPGAGAGIRAGKGSVTAPGVPLTAAYCPGRCTGGAG